MGFQKAGMKNSEMARVLGKHPSSIGRELQRGWAKGLHGRFGYSWKKAGRVRYERRRFANQQHRKLGFDADLTAHVRKKLSLDWAPEQIVGRMRGFGDTRISHTSIYRYLDTQAPELRIHLHSQKGKYRRTQAAGLRRLRRLQLSTKRDIDTRPIEVKHRTRLGDWEGDTVMGTDKRVRILTHADRRSGYLLTRYLQDSTLESVRAATQAVFSQVPDTKKHTVTLDNGHEFSNWEQVEQDTGITTYFARPYHSWERGTNENTNGLLRHYFPKGTSFATLKPRQLSRATALLNHRPRKRFGYLTPHEVFHGIAI
jgi:transposase, IS30 family